MYIHVEYRLDNLYIIKHLLKIFCLRTALFLATAEDYKEIVALLLEKGADHSTRDGIYGGSVF